VAEPDWEVRQGGEDAAAAAAAALSEEQEVLSAAEAAVEQFSDEIEAMDREDREREAAGQQPLTLRQLTFQQADVLELNTDMDME
jgi:hypothetical protein